MKNCLKRCIVLKFFCLSKKKRKNRKLLARLVIFSFFLLKWNYGKLGDSYAIFLFFHLLDTMEKMVRTNMIFFIFPFFYFLRKTKKQKNGLGIGRSPSNGASISHTSPWSQPFPEQIYNQNGSQRRLRAPTVGRANHNDEMTLLLYFIKQQEIRC